MKLRINYLLYGCILLSILIAIGCEPIAHTSELDLTLTPNEIVDIVTPSITTTQSADTTQTINPTLPVEEANIRLLNLLENNGNCQLPCVWGITPGKSTYSEAKMILSALSSISELPSSFQLETGVVFPVYADGDWILNTNIGFLSNNQIVRHVTFQARILKKLTAPNGEPGFVAVFDDISISPFSKSIEYYMLPNILSLLGVPVSVVIGTSAIPPYPNAAGGFDIVLIYPEQGVLAHYTTQKQKVGEMVQGCFTNSPVELELLPVSESALFSEGLASTPWAGFWPGPIDGFYWKSLEKATDMSLEEFYATFREPTDKCIETPINLWPTPEPQ